MLEAGGVGDRRHLAQVGEVEAAALVLHLDLDPVLGQVAAQQDAAVLIPRGSVGLDGVDGRDTTRRRSLMRSSGKVGSMEAAVVTTMHATSRKSGRAGISSSTT